MERLHLVDYQRVFLLVRGVADVLAQLVQVAQVLFPQLVDAVEQQLLLPLLYQAAAFGADGLLKVEEDAEDALAVGDGHGTYAGLAAFDRLAHDGHDNLLDALALAVEGLHSQGVQCLGAGLLVHRGVFLLGKRGLDGEYLHQLHLQVVIVGGLAVVVDKVLDGVEDHVGDVDADALADEGVVTQGVDEGTLLVHHVVIFEQVLADAEVVLLDALLGLLDRVVDHLVLEHLALLEAEAVEHLHDTLRGVYAHQGILEGDVED